MSQTRTATQNIMPSPAKAGALLEQGYTASHWHGWHVYMMASVNHRSLYIGRAFSLDLRVTEHKLKLFPKCFTAKYNCSQLVWYEAQESYEAACRREFRLKHWERAWKERLINEFNPDWLDLASFLDDEIMPIYKQDPRLRGDGQA